MNREVNMQRQRLRLTRCLHLTLVAHPAPSLGSATSKALRSAWARHIRAATLVVHMQRGGGFAEERIYNDLEDRIRVEA